MDELRAILERGEIAVSSLHYIDTNDGCEWVFVRQSLNKKGGYIVEWTDGFWIRRADLAAVERYFENLARYGTFDEWQAAESL